MLAHDRVEEAGERLPVGHVERECQAVVLLGGLLGEVDVEVADHHGGTLGRERPRGGGADPAGSTGEGDDLAVERSRHQLLLLLRRPRRRAAAIWAFMAAPPAARNAAGLAGYGVARRWAATVCDSV